MTVHQSAYITGHKEVSYPSETGEVYWTRHVIDTSVTNLATNDFYLLQQKDALTVIHDVKVGVSGTLGTSEIAVGIVDALAATALSTTFIAAQTFTTTAIVSANSLVMADTPLDNVDTNDGIIGFKITVQGESTAKIYVDIGIRAASYGH